MNPSPMPTVLLGPLSNDPSESVSAVNRTLMSGASVRYAFVASETNRRFGLRTQARWTAWNFYYLAKHLAIWMWNLARFRPAVAHYAINFGSALWKGLLFLRLARLRGAITVGHLHSGNFLEFWHSLPAFWRRRAARELLCLDALIVMSPRWRIRVAETLRMPLEKIHILPNPIDHAFEARVLTLPLSRTSAIFALGVMEQAKGVLDLVEASALLRDAIPDFKLHIVGPDREPGIRQKVESTLMRHALRPNVELRGRVTGEEKFELFARTGICVLPSYFENLPLVLLEAAAAGHAIITTPVGAVPEFFRHHESAIFVEPGRPALLRDALALLVKNPAERHRLGEAARRMFRQTFGRIQIMAQLDRIYDAVLETEPQTMISTCPHHRL